MTDDEIRKVEDRVNAMILQNAPVETHLMTPDQAIAQGALALFGEKYGEEVRVVSMGVDPQSERAGHAYSIELCGGTHVRRTGDIGLLKIVGEGAVASGVRRVEALTGAAARAYLDTQVERVREAAGLLKVSPDEMIGRLSAILDERRKLERELAETRKKLAMGGGAASQSDDSNIVTIGDTAFFRVRVTGLPNNDLKALADAGKLKVKSGVVAIANTAPDGKGGLVVGVTDDLTSRFDAVELVKVGAEALGGKGGGGRPDLAQAGGPDGARAEEALEAIAARIAGQAGGARAESA
jgi:alanyl-tRNA synthetase